MEPQQVQPLPVKLNLGEIAMKGHSSHLQN